MLYCLIVLVSSECKGSVVRFHTLWSLPLSLLKGDERESEAAKGVVKACSWREGSKVCHSMTGGPAREGELLNA